MGAVVRWGVLELPRLTDPHRVRRQSRLASTAPPRSTSFPTTGGGVGRQPCPASEGHRPAWTPFLPPDGGAGSVPEPPKCSRLSLPRQLWASR